jgi:hypothetical protein
MNTQMQLIFLVFLGTGLNCSKLKQMQLIFLVFLGTGLNCSKLKQMQLIFLVFLGTGLNSFQRDYERKITPVVRVLLK